MTNQLITHEARAKVGVDVCIPNCQSYNVQDWEYNICKTDLHFQVTLTEVSSYDICGGQNGTEANFLHVLSFPCSTFISHPVTSAVLSILTASLLKPNKRCQIREDWPSAVEDDKVLRGLYIEPRIT
jgi:hypothetical protein